jgi:hypothetical protein
MRVRTLAAAQRRSVEGRLAALAVTLASVKADGDASKLAEQLEDLGNRLIDLSEWLTISGGPSIRVDDAGVVGGHGSAA